MSKETQKAFDTLMSDVLVPLLTGGLVKLTRFFHPSVAETFAFGEFTSAEHEASIREALKRRVSELIEPQVLPFPELATMQMIMAGHNLVALTDPKLDRTFARGAIPKVRAWTEEIIGAVKPPRTRGQALVRHVFVDAFTTLRRKDTTVRNWAYTYRFPGRPPAANVVALPRLRFVKQSVERVPAVDLVEANELGRLWARWIRQSPITQLLAMPDTLELGIDELAVLSDSRLRYGIACKLAREVRDRSFAEPLGNALVELMSRSPKPEELLPAVLFCAELHALELMRTDEDLLSLASPGAQLYAALLGRLQMNARLREFVALEEVDMRRLRARAEAAAQVPKEVMAQVDGIIGVLISGQALAS